VKHDGINIIFMLLEIHRGPVILLDCSSCAATFSCLDFIELKTAVGTVKFQYKEHVK